MSGWRPGRDPRAAHHPGPEGTAYAEPGGEPVLVVGGGIAGITAAVGLAERGVEVVLVEPQAQLGGRVRAWPTGDGHNGGGDGRTMSRGFHAFFRQYYNLRGLIRRIDPTLAHLVAIDDYPLILAGGHQDSFARIPRTPPLNLAAFVAQSPSFRLADLAAVDVAAAMELLDVEFPATLSDYDGESAAQFLDRLGFPDGARHLALEVFARSFFARPEEFAAGELVAMFHSYFLGSAEGLLFDVPDDDYDTVLWAPLRRYLEGLGVSVRTGERVSAVYARDRLRVALETGEELAVSGVVLASDSATTRELLMGAGVEDAPWLARVAATREAPPFAVWRLWLDRLVDAERPPFVGTSGFGPLDNISVLERFEGGARRWSERHGGSVIELHAYALVGDRSEAALKEQLLGELHRLYPELVGAHAVAQEWLVSADCPLAGTGPWFDRLTVETPDPRIVLAGDGIRCDFPVALMERAATTGFLAANQLLAARGVRGHDLWTVPMRSRHKVSRPLHQLALRRPTRPRALT